MNLNFYLFYAAMYPLDHNLMYIKTKLYLIRFSHSESQQTFNITGDVDLILNSEFQGVFAFFDSDVESRSVYAEFSTVMLEFFSCIDNNINIINIDEIVGAIVVVKFSSTVALNEITYFVQALKLAK